ncbi:unnamed protein product, partial [Tetraodon nigroviridis]
YDPSCLPAWQHPRKRRRGRPPRRCRPPSSWTNSWAKFQATTPESDQISKVGKASGAAAEPFPERIRPPFRFSVSFFKRLSKLWAAVWPSKV